MDNIGSVTYAHHYTSGPEALETHHTEDRKLVGLPDQIWKLMGDCESDKGRPMRDRLNHIQEILRKRNYLECKHDPNGQRPIPKSIDLIRNDLSKLNETYATLHSTCAQAGLVLMKLRASGFTYHQSKAIPIPGAKPIGGPNGYRGESSLPMMIVHGSQSRTSVVQRRTALINEITQTAREKLQEHIKRHGPAENLQRGAALFHRGKLLLLACPVDRMQASHSTVSQIVESMGVIPCPPGSTKHLTPGTDQWYLTESAEKKFTALKSAAVDMERLI